MDRESQKAYEQFVRQQERYNAGHANVTQANLASYPSAGSKQYPSYADIQEAARQRNQPQKCTVSKARSVAQAMRQSDLHGNRHRPLRFRIQSPALTAAHVVAV